MPVNFAKIAKVTRIFFLCENIEQQTWQKQQEQQISQNSTLRKTKGQEGLQDVRKFRKISKSNEFFMLCEKIEQQIWQKQQEQQISQNSTLGKRKGQEGLRDVRKFRKNRKSNKNFSCYVKRLSNKYGKNSKNNKFYKIRHLEREKVKKGFEMSTNFAKIAKVTRIFPPM